MLQYIDDFFVIGYGKLKVKSAAAALCDALKRVGGHYKY